MTAAMSEQCQALTEELRIDYCLSSCLQTSGAQFRKLKSIEGTPKPSQPVIVHMASNAWCMHTIA